MESGSAGFSNTCRNAIVALVVLVLSMCITLGVSSVVFTLLVKPEYIKNDFVDALRNFIPFKVMWLYLMWWIKNPNVQLVAYNYLPLKIALSLAVPNLALLFFIVAKRQALYQLRPYKEKESIHGSARWATRDDIKKANLRSKKGLLLGEDEDGFFVAGGYQHILLFAPTGSGKGVGFVIPNLLFWEESAVVHDIKMENFDLTSGWRQKQGQKVFIWNPANPDGFTHCYNPLDFISSKPGQMVDDTQKIVKLLLPKQDFWVNEARSFLVGVILYLIADPNKTQSFGEVVRTLRSDDVAYNLAVVLDTMGGTIHPVAYMNLAAFLQKADKERSGVLSTANSELELWVNPLIDTATASSDFSVMDLKKCATTVYVGVTPDNLKRLQPLLQVFYQQATEFLCRKLPGDDEPYGVLFLMDEFPSLGKMEQFMIGIAYFRGYHVRLFLIVQDTEQLKGTYEQSGMNSFLSNSTYRVTFAANNVETAELISKLCGNKTVEQVSQSRPKFFDLNPGSRSQNVSETQRALLLPQEVINLSRDEQILLIEASPPIKSKKIKYYANSVFKKRLLPAIAVPQQVPYESKKKLVEKHEQQANKGSTDDGGGGGGKDDMNSINAGENDNMMDGTNETKEIAADDNYGGGAGGNGGDDDIGVDDVFVGKTELIEDNKKNASGDEESTNGSGEK